MAQRKRYCLSSSGADFDPWARIRRDGGAEHQSLVSAHNIRELNSKSLRISCEVVCIRDGDFFSSKGDVKRQNPSVSFDKNKLMPAPGFSFNLPHLTFIIHKLRHNTTFTLGRYTWQPSWCVLTRIG